MRKPILLYVSFALIILLGFLQFVADTFYLYWTLWWFDNLMHFLGGFSLGFFILYIFFGSDFFGGKLSFLKAALLSFIFTMIVGGVWEVFEYANDVSIFTEKYDTLHDLIADALGATLALLVVRRFLEVS